MRLENNTTVANGHPTDRYFRRAGTLSVTYNSPLVASACKRFGEWAKLMP
jgi:hypothetical protein